jgi:hypothetical protein
VASTGDIIGADDNLRVYLWHDFCRALMVGVNQLSGTIPSTISSLSGLT